MFDGVIFSSKSLCDVVSRLWCGLGVAASGAGAFAGDGIEPRAGIGISELVKSGADDCVLIDGPRVPHFWLPPRLWKLLSLAAMFFWVFSR